MIEKEARLKVINLSRLEEIKDLRTVWPHEALDFTPWLSQDDNISLLADAVEMDITVDETESSVGDFNVDIFASETGTDRKIIIENQLEDTNHDHLLLCHTIWNRIILNSLALSEILEKRLVIGDITKNSMNVFKVL